MDLSIAHVSSRPCFQFLVWLYNSYILEFPCYSLFLLSRVSLYIPGCPGTYSKDQAGPELCLPMLGLKACTIITQLKFFRTTVLHSYLLLAQKLSPDSASWHHNIMVFLRSLAFPFHSPLWQPLPSHLTLLPVFFVAWWLLLMDLLSFLDILCSCSFTPGL